MAWVDACLFILIMNILSKNQASTCPGGIKDGVSTKIQVPCDLKLTAGCCGSAEERDTLGRLGEAF